MNGITGYTPGPWLVGGKENEWIEDNNYPCRRRIAIIDNGAGINSPEANARLFAAAPEMADRIRKLEAQNAAMLTELIDFCRGNCDTCELQECTDTCGLIGAKNIIETIEGRKIEEVI